MVYFTGAGPGAPDLLTLRGKELLENADVVIYAGSLVNPLLLSFCKKDCEIYNSAVMTLEEIIAVIEKSEKENKTTVRLHTGDPCLYGAINEQMGILDKKGIDYDICPGVSSFCGAAAALKTEYTIPGISQSVIITRMEGNTLVPGNENIELMAAHQAPMVIFLSMGLLKQLEKRLIKGGYPADTPAAIVYKATWKEEKVYRCSISTINKTAKENGITKTALVIVGKFLNGGGIRSKLYDPSFSTEYRDGSISGSRQG